MINTTAAFPRNKTDEPAICSKAPPTVGPRNIPMSGTEEQRVARPSGMLRRHIPHAVRLDKHRQGALAASEQHGRKHQQRQ